MIRTTTPLALALSTLLLAGTAALAGPKTPRPAVAAPQVTYLTPTEQLCQIRGVYTLTFARARDGGMSLLSALDLSRRLQVRLGTDAQTQAGAEAIIRLVYDFPRLSPTTLQQEMERGCLTRMTAQDLGMRPPEAEDARLRY